MARQASAATRVIRALFSIGLLQFLSMLLMLIKTKVIAVTLGPADVGAMSVIDKITALIAQMLSLSLPFAALRFLPAELRESPEKMTRLYQKMRVVLLSLILPAALACVLAAVLKPEIWGAALLPRQVSLVLAFVGLPVVAMVPFLTNSFAGGMQHDRAMKFSIAHSAVLVLAALAAAFGFGLSGFYGVYALLGVGVVIIAARAVTPTCTTARLAMNWREAWQLPAGIWRFAGALLALTVAAPYAALFVQYSTLQKFGAEASGILQAAIGISLSARTLLGAAHAVFLTPNINREADSQARMAAANEFQRATGLLFLLALPPLLLFADIAVRALYSHEFVAGSAFVVWFVAAEVVTMLSGTYQSIIVASDRLLFHVLQNLTAQAILIGTAAYLLPRVGLVGAGVAALAAAVFLFVTTLIFLNRAFALRVSREAATMAAVAIAALIVCGAIGSYFPGIGWNLLGLKILACIVAWLLAYCAISRLDRARFRDAVSHVLKLVSGGPSNRRGTS